MMGNVIDTHEAAERLGKSVWTVTRWVREGRLEPAMKLNVGRHGAYLFDPDVIDQLAEEQ